VIRRSSALLALALACAASSPAAAQRRGPAPRPITDSTLARLWRLGMDSSRAAEFAQVLMDSVGPRLTGSPGHLAGNDWLVKTYAAIGITARNEQYGTWRRWQRGVSHLDLVAPRVRSLEAMTLAWSPGTKRPVQAAVIPMPLGLDSAGFAAWLPSAKGKAVLASAHEPTCRPPDNWERWATPESRARIQAERDSIQQAFGNAVRATGLGPAGLARALENAGAVAVLTSRWSLGWGVNKIFSASTERVPTFDVSCEDYGLLWRLAERNQGPVVQLSADAQFLGEQPVFNTIATIPGEKADEFVMLSAHFDSWDGGSGATDNGTGTITMLEAARLLSIAYPKPKRTIVIGHWGGEEQGLNGSHAFVEDHPEVVKGLQALWNQDNGTGRIATVSASGFAGAVPNFAQWIAALPEAFTRELSIQLPGSPSGGGTDHASFVCAGAPGFNLSATPWNYSDYTWHTQRDTYDKVVLDDLKHNATMTAMLAYLAAEDPEFTGRGRVDGVQWPTCSPARRRTPEAAR
jgi:hypothetical protein